MSPADFEPCPGCGRSFPPLAGPTHPYIGASPTCWAIFANLLNAGEPPLASAPLNGLIGDAYAAQHPGSPSKQAIQSVAVHLLTLYGVLARGVAPDTALWIRLRALRNKPGGERGRFQWLTPPAFAGSLTIADVAQAPTPRARSDQAHLYIEQVWSLWSQIYQPTIAAWYDSWVLPDRLPASSSQ